MEPKPDDVIEGKYRIVRLLGKGGMGAVYEGENTRVRKRVAIKVLHAEVGKDPAIVERFEREAQAAGCIGSEHIVEVYDMGELADGERFMVMEFLDGESLGSRIERVGHLQPEQLFPLAVQLLDGLGAAHAAGIIHRDLKPDNIMIDADDRIKLIDFGIAREAGARRLTFARLTKSMGTPDYVSPEQVKGKRGDQRSDLYALGVMLYEMLTGKVPFSGANPFLIMNDRLLNNPVPPREVDPAISPQLQEIIYRALERDPKNRYASARDFAADLEHPETIGVTDRPEFRNWKDRRTPWRKNVLFYILLALIPIIIFALLLYVAHHS